MIEVRWRGWVPLTFQVFVLLWWTLVRLGCLIWRRESAQRRSGWIASTVAGRQMTRPSITIIVLRYELEETSSLPQNRPFSPFLLSKRSSFCWLDMLSLSSMMTSSETTNGWSVVVAVVAVAPIVWPGSVWSGDIRSQLLSLHHLGDRLRCSGCRPRQGLCSLRMRLGNSWGKFHHWLATTDYKCFRCW